MHFAAVHQDAMPEILRHRCTRLGGVHVICKSREHRHRDRAVPSPTGYQCLTIGIMHQDPNHVCPAAAPAPVPAKPATKKPAAAPGPAMAPKNPAAAAPGPAMATKKPAAAAAAKLAAAAPGPAAAKPAAKRAAAAPGPAAAKPAITGRHLLASRTFCASSTCTKLRLSDLADLSLLLVTLLSAGVQS